MVLPSLALSARRRAVLLLSLGAASTTPLAAQYGGWLEEMDLTTQLSAAVTYDSNLLQTDPEIDDVILIGGASAELSREFRFATLSATLSGNIQRFLDYDVLNNEDIFLNWGIDSGETLGNRRFRLQVDFDVQEGSSADLDVRGRVTTRRYSTGGTLTYRASAAIEAGVGLRYSKSDPQGGVFRLDTEEGLVETNAAFGNETLTYLANLRYIRTARLSFFAQASHSETESENSARGDSENQRYSVGVDGQILATLSGRLGAGLQTRSFDGENTTGPYVEGSLNWRISELTGASLSLQRSFDTSLNGAEAVRN
ncbi:MAG: outer membrane beta-barrel protein, partial [Verrucomicrobiota bacterium]